MKKGTIVSGVISHADFPDKGVMILEDGEKSERVIVKKTIKGQRVTARINKARSGKCEAALLSVDEKSVLEDGEVLCPHFGACGGCSYQTMRYETQLSYKAGQVRELLDKAVGNGEDFIFEEPVASPKQKEYRNKMEFTFGNEYKDGPLVLGLHKKGSFYDIVPVTECAIADNDIREILTAVMNWAEGTGLGFYHKITKKGYFRHLLVRRAEADGGLMIDLITRGDVLTQDESDNFMQEFKDKLLGLSCSSRIRAVLHTVNDSDADAVIDQGTRLLYGEGYLTEELLGLSFKITPFSFFQTNSLGAERLYEKAREYVNEALSGDDGAGVNDKKAGVLYDLYSGIGTIGQLMSAAAERVYGIEIVEEAAAAANENAGLNGLEGCSFIAGDVLKKLEDIEERPDIIVLDPPREGVNPKALIKILSYGVESLIYISCKPTSLAFDLQAIQAAGYRLKKACCIDLFPFTTGIETICLLKKQDPGTQPVAE